MIPQLIDAPVARAYCAAAQGHRVLADVILTTILAAHPNHRDAQKLQLELANEATGVIEGYLSRPIRSLEVIPKPLSGGAFTASAAQHRPQAART
jgi:hypothetical protein